MSEAKKFTAAATDNQATPEMDQRDNYVWEMILGSEESHFAIDITAKNPEEQGEKVYGNVMGCYGRHGNYPELNMTEEHEYIDLGSNGNMKAEIRTDGSIVVIFPTKDLVDRFEADLKNESDIELNYDVKTVGEMIEILDQKTQDSQQNEELSAITINPMRKFQCMSDETVEDLKQHVQDMDANAVVVKFDGIVYVQVPAGHDASEFSKSISDKYGWEYKYYTHTEDVKETLDRVVALSKPSSQTPTGVEPG